MSMELKHTQPEDAKMEMSRDWCFLTRNNYSIIKLRGSGPYMVTELILKDASQVSHVKDPSDINLSTDEKQVA
jgi:hypothetical protein